MKKLLTVFLGLIALLLSSYSQTGFNSVHSTNGNVVHAAGEGGNYFVSYDGGATFGSYPVGSDNYNCVFAINSRVVLVGDAGVVKVSVNGGNSFSAYNLGGSDLNSVWFADDNTGWAVGNAGRIVKTVNGGLNWTPQTAPGADNLNGVKFTSSTNGYACGDNGKVIYTLNGGTNWLSYTTGSTIKLTSIDVNGTTIIATGFEAKILKYDGSLWSTIDYKIVTKTDVRSVSMINPTTFYTCGGGGFVNKTTDGGATRVYQQNPMMGYLSDIFFFDANKGWAVASNTKAIIRTSDGGATWQFQGGVTVNTNWVLKHTGATGSGIGNGFCYHPKNKDGAFCMIGNSVYRSLDKGETWTSVGNAPPSPWTANCHSFYVNVNDTNLWIASKGTGGGYVIVSTDYGNSWSSVLGPINLTSYGMPLEVDPNTPNTVYIAPDNAAMRISTNWGTNWTTLSGGEPGGVFRSPCDVIIQYENSNVIIVGDGTTGSGSGKLWKSVNGGMNWTLINTVSGSEIPMIANSSLDLNLMYHTTWSSGSFWKSVNMGSNFSITGNGGVSSLWAADVAKDDPTAVAYGTYSTSTWYSTNSGINFVAETIGGGSGAGALYLDKSTLLFTQTNKGIYKLDISYTVTPVTGTQQTSGEIPNSFELSQNYPNPFNPSTQIKYDVAKASDISIKVYDVIGNEVAVLVNGNQQAGKYTADFNASNLATGIYFYSLIVDGSKVDTKKMILVK
ncbi:MAG: T9SS type A sorting domain-containing protein [Ignavibacteria bacterium]|nr:T9SS type A sorting domain-containing protein [Ignavibacteria bacterium]